MSPRTLQGHLPGICVGDSQTFTSTTSTPLSGVCREVLLAGRPFYDHASSSPLSGSAYPRSPDMFTTLHAQDDPLLHEFVSSLLSLVCFSNFDCQLFPVLSSRSSPDSHFSAQYLIHCPHITAVSVWVPLKADPETWGPLVSLGGDPWQHKQGSESGQDDISGRATVGRNGFSASGSSLMNHVEGASKFSH